MKNAMNMPFILHTVFGGDNLLNCKIKPNSPSTSPDGYSECGYKKQPVTLVHLFKKALNYCMMTSFDFSRDCIPGFFNRHN